MPSLILRYILYTVRYIIHDTRWCSYELNGGQREKEAKSFPHLNN